MVLKPKCKLLQFVTEVLEKHAILVSVSFDLLDLRRTVGLYVLVLLFCNWILSALFVHSTLLWGLPLEQWPLV